MDHAVPTATRAARLDIISDAICPWCWIGKRQLEIALPILAEQGWSLSVTWRPYQLNPDMPKAGVERAAYRAAKFGSLDRSHQLDAQVAEAGRQVGLEFRHDRMLRTPNTVDAHRLIALAGREGAQDSMVETLFRTYFHDGRDIGDHAVLADAAAEAGMDRVGVIDFLASGDGAAQVLAEDQAARQAGLDGVPSFALDGHIMFSGAVPGETMARAIPRAYAAIHSEAA